MRLSLAELHRNVPVARRRMATTGKTKQENTPRGVLEALSQSDAAWLINEHTSWLRDHPHLDGRNADGSYNARNLVRAVRTDFQPTELPDADLEFGQQVAEDLSWGPSRATPAAQMLEGIRVRYGAGGMAAFAMMLLSALQENAKSDPPLEPDKSPQQIRAEAASRAEKLIDDLRYNAARAAGRTVFVCECGKYRWGRSWLAAPIPPGYAPRHGEIVCPSAKCQAKVAN